MCSSRLAAIDSSVFAGLGAVHIHLAPSPVVGLVRRMDSMMLKTIVGAVREGGSGIQTIPDLDRTLASLLSLWT